MTAVAKHGDGGIKTSTTKSAEEIEGHDLNCYSMENSMKKAMAHTDDIRELVGVDGVDLRERERNQERERFEGKATEVESMSSSSD
ncbi:hypothetical protein V6N11_047322 [Hibiscus sabdariffa]|uniref:Uncharacterized protein n=1 Tax=Hibiscus sabdariffa TaxID=183260 RepID=A0ABR2PBN7_9ROSI